MKAIRKIIFSTIAEEVGAWIMLGLFAFIAVKLIESIF